MKTERRRWPRVKPGQDTTVLCYSAEFAGPAAGRNNLAIRAVDLGGKGACLLTVGRLRERLPVIVEIALPKENARLKAKAVVVWSRTLVHKSQEANVAGVEFLQILEAFGEKVQFMTAGCRKSRAAPVGDDLKHEHRNTLLKETKLVCRTKGFWSAIGFASEIPGRLTGLTAEGFQMVCPARIKTGRRLDARLDFNSPRSTVTAVVVVQSCRRDTLVLEPRYEVEAVFASIPPESQANLDGIVALLRSYSSEGPKAP